MLAYLCATALLILPGFVACPSPQVIRHPYHKIIIKIIIRHPYHKTPIFTAPPTSVCFQFCLPQLSFLTPCKHTPAPLGTSLCSQIYPTALLPDTLHTCRAPLLGTAALGCSASNSPGARAVARCCHQPASSGRARAAPCRTWTWTKRWAAKHCHQPTSSDRARAACKTGMRMWVMILVRRRARRTRSSLLQALQPPPLTLPAPLVSGASVRAHMHVCVSVKLSACRPQTPKLPPRLHCRPTGA